MVQTHDLHSDDKETLVQIGDKLYKLVDSGLTIEDVKKLTPDKTPHVRHLNPIPLRSKEEQQKKNSESVHMHNLSQKAQTAKKTVSMEEVVEDGGELSEVVKKLLEEKKVAKASKDKKKIRLIRRQLRKLNYKRYLKKEA